MPPVGGGAVPAIGSVRGRNGSVVAMKRNLLVGTRNGRRRSGSDGYGWRCAASWISRGAINCAADACQLAQKSEHHIPLVNVHLFLVQPQRLQELVHLNVHLLVELPGLFSEHISFERGERLVNNFPRLGISGPDCNRITRSWIEDESLRIRLELHNVCLEVSVELTCGCV